MILFIDDYKKDYKETPSGILLGKPKELIISQGIVTMDMATDVEKAVIYGEETIKEKSFIYV